MVGAFHASRARGRSISVMLPPPAPVPRFSLLPPLPPSEPTLDDADPTRPWMPDPPTTPYTPAPTPATSWAIPSSSWEDDPATLARNAPTIRPPSRTASSRPRVAVYGFAAGLALGAFGLIAVLGVEATSDATGRAHVHGAIAGAGAPAVAPAPPPAVTWAAVVVAPTASSAVPVVRAEDLPRASVRVEDLPAVVARTRGSRKRR